MLSTAVRTAITNVRAMYATDPSTWIQHSYARNRLGLDTSPHDKDATCFCLIGAVRKETRMFEPVYSDTMKALRAKLGDAIPNWNDVYGRTVADVVQMLDEVLAETA